MCVCTVLFCIFLCTWVESDELRAPPALRSVSVLFSRQAARADLNNWFINQQKYFKFMTGLNMRRVFLISEYTKTVKKASEKSDKNFQIQMKNIFVKTKKRVLYATIGRFVFDFMLSTFPDLYSNSKVYFSSHFLSTFMSL